LIHYARSNQGIIEELKRGREALLSDESLRSLLNILRHRLKSITPNLYVLKWIPEQGEDLYDILVDGNIVAHFEVSRSGVEADNSFRTWSVEEYVHLESDMTKTSRRTLNLALELARSATK
jgi:hypothetical protein